MNIMCDKYTKFSIIETSFSDRLKFREGNIPALMPPPVLP